MIHLDLTTGVLRAGNQVIGRPGMKCYELNSLHSFERTTDTLGNQIYRSTNEDCWLDYWVESIAVAFAGENCIGFSINLFPIDADNGKIAEELLITRHLRTHLHGSEKVRGKSEVLFSLEWGVISCIYDFKIAAPSISIRYK